MNIDEDDPLVQAAFDVFSRYGLRKTTMADIARASGVSRQTLYNRFANKDEVFRAAVVQLGMQRFGLMQADWAQTDDMGQKLDAFFRSAPLHWYDLICQSPDAADLVEALNTIARDEVEHGTAIWKSALAELLAPYHGHLAKSGTSAQDTADFLVTSAYSAKSEATDRPHLLRRLAVLRAATLALLGEDATPPT